MSRREITLRLDFSPEVVPTVFSLSSTEPLSESLNQVTMKRSLSQFEAAGAGICQGAAAAVAAPVLSGFSSPSSARFKLPPNDVVTGSARHKTKTHKKNPGDYPAVRLEDKFGAFSHHGAQ